MAYNSRLLPRDTGPGKSSSIQTYPCGNTVGAVVSTAHAFRLADFTADRDSHPALKLCGCKGSKKPEKQNQFCIFGSFWDEINNIIYQAI